MEITAQVLANLGDRQALLLLRGNPVLVKTSGPLEEGSEIQVNMTRQGRSSGVNLVSMNSLKGDLILGKLSGNLMIGHKPISEWMGTIWDALRLADRRILDVILKIVPLDEKTNPFSIPTFDKQTGGLPPDRIKSLLLEFLNSVAQRNEDFLTLPFPVEFQKERTTVTIMLGKKAKGRKKGKEKEKREVVFLLELQALGKVRIDAFLNSKSISIKIGIAEEDLVPFVKPFLPELKERLDSSGFQVQSLDCFHIKNPDDEEPFLKGISPDGEIPLIDLLI
jgi:hypothetical protein